MLKTFDHFKTRYTLTPNLQFSKNNFLELYKDNKELVLLNLHILRFQLCFKLSISTIRWQFQINRSP